MKLVAFVASALGLAACVEPPPPPVTVTWDTVGQHPFITDDRISTIVDMRDLDTDETLDVANIPGRAGNLQLSIDRFANTNVLATTVRICVNLYYSSGTDFGSVQDPLGVGRCDNFAVTEQAIDAAFTLQMTE